MSAPESKARLMDALLRPTERQMWLAQRQKRGVVFQPARCVYLKREGKRMRGCCTGPHGRRCKGGVPYWQIGTEVRHPIPMFLVEAQGATPQAALEALVRARASDRARWAEIRRQQEVPR